MDLLQINAASAPLLRISIGESETNFILNWDNMKTVSYTYDNSDLNIYIQWITN